MIYTRPKNICVGIPARAAALYWREDTNLNLKFERYIFKVPYPHIILILYHQYFDYLFLYHLLEYFQINDLGI